MKSKLNTAVLLVFLVAVLLCPSVYASDWATSVHDYHNLGPIPYDDPLSVVGKPTTLILDLGSTTFHCSMVYSAWNTAPDGSKLIATIEGYDDENPTVEDHGYIVVEFDPVIWDDPENWYGKKDFIVFGNSLFTGNGYVEKDTNMEDHTIKNGAEGSWEPMTVSVSQDGAVWYPYTDGPYADDYAPTQSFAWDWVEDTWGCELDFTKPVPSSWTKSDFAGKSVAEAIDMFRASGGGTAFDLADVGLQWIRYVKVTADILDEDEFVIEGQLDAIVRVGHTSSPVSVSDTKKMPDGTHVVLEEAVVSAGTFEVGRYCYVQHPDRSCGIRVAGRVLDRGQQVVVYGVTDTVGGERVIRSTALEAAGGPADVAAVGMPNRDLGGGDFCYDPGQGTGQSGVVDGIGLNNIGLLVRTWGRVKSADPGSKTFVIDDGSGRDIKCVGPRRLPYPDDPPNPTNPDWGAEPDPDFSLPAQDAYVSVTGISSCEVSGQSELVSVVRLRDQHDLKNMQPGP